jgi:hypothetical protein
MWNLWVHGVISNGKKSNKKEEGTRQSSLLNLELGNTGKDISNLREKKPMLTSY